MEQILDSTLPSKRELNSLLDLRHGGEIEDLVESSLLAPLDEFLNRPSKHIRAKILEAGYRLASNDMEEWDSKIEKICREGASVLEAIHSASLVIDDIQDGSLERRGAPTLHRSHGVPLALNAGNWLYFWPFERMKDWNLPEKRRLSAYEVCHRALLRAHFGQALDVGVPVDTLEQERVEKVCFASLELKTGALMSLAIALGGILGGASSSRLEELEEFGNSFGVALQMFDDIGNVKGKGSKQFEDLKLRRPSWVWAFAARTLSKEEYQEFLSCVKALPDESQLESFLKRTGLLEKATELAREYLEHSHQELEAKVGGAPGVIRPLGELRRLGEVLVKSYG